MCRSQNTQSEREKPKNEERVAEGENCFGRKTDKN